MSEAREHNPLSGGQGRSTTTFPLFDHDCDVTNFVGPHPPSQHNLVNADGRVDILQIAGSKSDHRFLDLVLDLVG